MKDKKLRYTFSLRLFFEEKAFGPGIATLLRKIQKKGSLLGAAKEMEMSYSKAWKMIRNTEKEWGFLLTDKETGGRDGGGSTLTPQAILLLEQYEKFEKDAGESLDIIFEKYFSDSCLKRIREEKK